MMMQGKHSRVQLLLLLLALVGAGISVYLTSVHYENVPLVCSTSGIVDCARVLSSPFSVIPGTTIPITIPGLLWCLAAAALAIVAWRFMSPPRWIVIAQFVLMLAGMFTVLYLVYVELVRLHTICAWCTALHVIILVMFLIALVQLQRPTYEAETATAEESEPLTREYQRRELP